jgi:hypothetical protein
MRAQASELTLEGDEMTAHVADDDDPLRAGLGRVAHGGLGRAHSSTGR